MRQQQLRRGVVLVLLAAPARLLESDAGIGAPLRRHLGEQRFSIGGVGGKRQTGLRRKPVICRRQRQHMLRRIEVAVPNQAIEPLLVVFVAQHSPVAHQKGALVRGIEIAVDPRRSNRRGAGLRVAAVEQDLRGARLPNAADRRVALQPVGGDIVVFAGQRFFGPPQQFLVQRPIRVLIDKRGELGETAARCRPAIVQPADDLQRESAVGDLACLGIGLRPVAGVCCRDCRKRRAVGIVLGPDHRDKRGKDAE